MEMTSDSETRPIGVIGMLGGMSWESTAEYYRLANRMVHQLLGGYHSARVLISSVDFAEIERLQAAGDWEGAATILTAEALALERAGADLMLLCTNTMHIVADQISSRLRIPLLHIGDVTAEAVTAAGLTTVGLLGTAFTMEQDFYRARMSKRGITTIIPGDEDRRLVHRIIYEELVHGVINPESRVAYQGVIDRLVASGSEGIILGCTEIELLVAPENCRVPSFPTARLHVEAAVRHASRVPTATLAAGD